MTTLSVEDAHSGLALRGAGPVASPIQEYLESLRAELARVGDGVLATYIPELGRADPDWFGISVATVDGHVYEVGDTSRPFTIQSISKPFVFGLALEDNGHVAVTERVGVEPSGNPFNSISVEAATNRPFNPMVNAGAIVTASMVRDAPSENRLERVLAMFSHYVGHEVEIDQAVFESECETGDRNRAIAYLMRTFGKLGGDVNEALDRYFAQCAALVTSRDLAMMAATLANGGEHPVTKERAIEPESVPRVLSIMSSCGMYDYAGEWIYSVGLPAKSGVSGGLLAVLPGQLGIGVYSPPLDPRGNSVRGVRVCQRLSADLLLHPFRSAARGSVVRHDLRGNEARSRRIRSADEDEKLAEYGKVVAVYELQGDLFFASIDAVVRRILDDVEQTEFVVLDCKRVHQIDEAALRMLARLSRNLVASGRQLVVSHLDVASGLSLVGGDGEPQFEFADTDEALEWCENQLLARFETPRRANTQALKSQELLQGLSADEISAVADVVETRSFDAGQTVFQAGDVAGSMCFVVSGSVSVRLPLEGTARTRRLATFGPGCAFGEMALLDEGRRSADVVADEPAMVGMLSLDALRALEATPRLGNVMKVIYLNLARNLSRRLRNANAQIGALDR